MTHSRTMKIVLRDLIKVVTVVAGSMYVEWFITIIQGKNSDFYRLFT